MKALILSLILALSCFGVEYRVCESVNESTTVDGVKTVNPTTNMYIGFGINSSGAVVLMYENAQLDMYHNKTINSGEDTIHYYKQGGLHLITNHNHTAAIIRTTLEDVTFAVNYTCRAVIKD